MPGVEEIIKKASGLPVEDRIMIVETLLKGLNNTTQEIDGAWIALARKRREDIHSGSVEPVSIDNVYEKFKHRTTS